MINVALKIEIVPNDNDKEREDKFGRIRISRRRTWVLLVNGDFYAEYDTKREVVARAAKFAATAS